MTFNFATSAYIAAVQFIQFKVLYVTESNILFFSIRYFYCWPNSRFWVVALLSEFVGFFIIPSINVFHAEILIF
uniref:Uncharacterized protein n=1 Tax=Panagrolaimus sp. JU765 TaxID=591449 RepID=A0AC34PWF4_9BILA